MSFNKILSMNPIEIREIAASFQKSRILLSAFELDLFTNIDENGVTSKHLTDSLNLDYHACDRLSDALVAIGFLKKGNELFFNTDVSFPFLSKKGQEYFGGLMNNERTRPSTGAITAINMLIGTDKGDCLTDKDVNSMLPEAGFNNISGLEFESGLSQVTVF